MVNFPAVQTCRIAFRTKHLSVRGVRALSYLYICFVRIFKTIKIYHHIYDKQVAGLVPGLAADLSSVVRAGDLVVSIDAFGTLSMDLEDVR